MARNMHLIPFILITFWTSSISCVLSAPIPPSATIGVILPLTGPQARDGLKMKAVLDLLLNDVNTGGSIGGLPANSLGCPLKLAYADSVGDPLKSISSVHKLIASEGPNLFGFIGDLHDNTTYPMALLTSQLQYLTITPGATAPSFVDNTQFDYLFRTSHNDELYADLWATNFPYLSWYRVAMLTTDEDSARGFTDALLHHLADAEVTDPTTNITSNPYDVKSYVLPALRNAVFDNVLDQALTELLASDFRIFLLHAGERNGDILQAAWNKGLIGLGSDGILRQWIGEFCSDEIAARFQSQPQILAGTVCSVTPYPRVRDDVPTEPNALAFQTRLRASAPDLYPTGTVITALEYAASNALTAWVSVLSNVFNNASLTNDRTVIRDALVGVTVQQIGGDNNTFSESGDLSTDFDIINYDLATNRYIIVGSVDGETHQGTTTRDIIWVNGLSETPKDRARIYITDDELPSTWDSQTQFLSYVIIVLGAWTSLILLEQALSFWSRGMWMHATGWVSLCSIAFGCCAIWPCWMINYTGLVLDADASQIWFQRGTMAASIIYALFSTMIAFMIALLSVPGGRKPAPNVNVNEVSDISATSSATTEQSDSNSAISTSAKARKKFTQIKTRMLKRWNKFSDFMVETIKLSSWKLPLASLLLAIIYTTQHLLVRDGLYMKASVQFDTGAIIGAIIITWFINFIALIIYFHVTRHGLRYTGPFILGVSCFAGFCLPMVIKATWVYEGGVDITPAAVAQFITKIDKNLEIYVAVACAITCLLLMAFNVNRLRVSRNALDKVLAQVSGQVRSLESQIDYEKDSTTALLEQVAFIRRSIEIISLCRPVWRPYAIALALADPDEAASLKAKNAALGVNKPTAEKAVEKSVHHKKKDAGAPGGSDKKSSLGSGGEMSKSDPSKSSPSDVQVPDKSEKKDTTATAPKDSDTKATAPLLTTKSTQPSANSPNGGRERERSPSLPGAVIETPADDERTGPIASKSSGGGHGSQEEKSNNSNTNQQSTSTTKKAHISEAATMSDWQRIHAVKQSKQLVALLKEIQELGNLSAPVPAKTLADIKLPQILSHPATLELMKDVLAKNLSPENIALWIDIQRYRSLDNLQVRKAVADEIFQTFIITGAKYEVNLSSFMKDYVQSAIYKNRITGDLFDEVEREIYRLMVTNNVDTLVSSSMFKLCSIILQHPQYRLQSMTMHNNSRGEIGGNVASTIGANTTVAPTAPAPATSPNNALTPNPHHPARSTPRPSVIGAGVISATGTPRLGTPGRASPNPTPSPGLGGTRVVGPHRPVGLGHRPSFINTNGGTGMMVASVASNSAGLTPLRTNNFTSSEPNTPGGGPGFTRKIAASNAIEMTAPSGATSSTSTPR